MKSIILRYRKILLMGILVAGIGFLLYKRNVSAQSQSLITTTQVLEKNFIKTISSSGKTKAKKSVDLKFQTSGRLRWVGIQEGDSVKAYQAIASLDTRDVQKSLEKSLRDYSAQRNDFDEMTKTTYGEKKETDVNDTIKRILQKNQWDLESAVLDVELKHLAAEYSTLITPIAGIVTHIDTPIAGINITPATATFEIIDPTTIQFEANIDEVDIGGVKLGQSASVTLDAYPDRMLEGTISAIAYSSQTSTGGATVFPIQITLSNPETLRVGFNGDVTITIDEQPRAIVIPLSALREKDKIKFVYRKKGKIFEKVQISTGASSDNESIVTQGLQVGDEVVIKGFNSIPNITP